MWPAASGGRPAPIPLNRRSSINSQYQ
ncbi:hypothetical protein EGY20_12230 [Burkholderia multivorans]|nr:hypothetical protein EGY20_12230 [Burkholderia multivorans]